MAALPYLPVELIIIISDYIGDDDFLRFRCTCRAIRVTTEPLFVQYFFHTRYVMIERRSLANLVSILCYPIFGRLVRALEVCMDYLTGLDEIYEILGEETRVYWLHALSNRGLLNKYKEYMDA